MYCSQCGAELKGPFCSQCGAPALYKGNGNQNPPAGNQYQGAGNQNQGSYNQYQGAGNQNQSSYNQYQGAGNQNLNVAQTLERIADALVNGFNYLAAFVQPKCSGSPFLRGMFDAVRACLKKSFELNGRASRSEYWYFQLFCVAVNAALGLVAGIILMFASGFAEMLRSPAVMFLPGVAVMAIGIAASVFTICVAPAQICTAVRRLHDSDLSGFAYLICLIPYIGAVIVLALLLRSSTPGGNKYGDMPVSFKY